MYLNFQEISQYSDNITFCRLLEMMMIQQRRSPSLLLRKTAELGLMGNSCTNE